MGPPPPLPPRASPAWLEPLRPGTLSQEVMQPSPRRALTESHDEEGDTNMGTQDLY